MNLYRVGVRNLVDFFAFLVVVVGLVMAANAVGARSSTHLDCR